MASIIDNPKELINLSRDDLDDILLNDKYNRPMLRELVRRTLKELKYSQELIKQLYKDMEMDKKIIDRIHELSN